VSSSKNFTEKYWSSIGKEGRRAPFKVFGTVLAGSLQRNLHLRLSDLPFNWKVTTKDEREKNSKLISFNKNWRLSLLCFLLHLFILINESWFLSPWFLDSWKIWGSLFVERRIWFFEEFVESFEMWTFFFPIESLHPFFLIYRTCKWKKENIYWRSIQYLEFSPLFERKNKGFKQDDYRWVNQKYSKSRNFLKKVIHHIGCKLCFWSSAIIWTLNDG